MPHGSRFRYQSGRTVSRRKTSWSRGPQGSVTNVTTSSVILFGGGSQALVDNITLVRTRGSLLLTMVGSDAIGEGFSWFFGMCNVTENAFNAGVGSVPAPLTDISWDGWAVYEMGSMVQPTATADQLVGVPISERRVIDSKAMRKVHNSDVLVAVLETVIKGTGVSMQAFLETRVLDKGP